MSTRCKRCVIVNKQVFVNKVGRRDGGYRRPDAAGVATVLKSGGVEPVESLRS